MKLQLTFSTAQDFEEFNKLNSSENFLFFAEDANAEFRTVSFECDDQKDMDSLEAELSMELQRMEFNGYHFSAE